MIIGLSGKIGVGKTQMAKNILSRAKAVAIPCRRIAFGDLLKEEAARHFKVPLDWCYSEKGKSRVVSVPQAWRFRILPASLLTRITLGRKARLRTVLQWYGTDWVRRHYPDHWTEAMRERLKNPLSAGEIVVIDDVRFPNEKALVSRLGGLNVRLNPWNGWQPGSYAHHTSETALDFDTSWDLILNGPKFEDIPRLANILLCLAALKRDDRNVDNHAYYDFADCENLDQALQSLHPKASEAV